MSCPKILLVEDQKSMALLLEARLSESFTNHEILVAHSLHEAHQLISTHAPIDICLTDLTLPDSNDYEIVKMLREHKITTVVFTGSYSSNVRKKVFDFHVADYIIKDGQTSIDFAISSIQSIIQNTSKKVWLISNHIKFLQRAQGLLRIHRYKLSVYESYESVLLDIRDSVPDILIVDKLSLENKLSIYDFVKEIRLLFSAQELPIVAMENREKLNRSLKLMKFGVSDLLSDNFEPEELYLRINKNLSQCQAYKDIKRISERDGLTGIYNRRAFFDFATIQFNQMQNVSKNMFLVMVDIDFFKRVNDQYGHQVGDEAIKFTAAYLRSVFSSAIVARFGGEEFVVFGEVDDRSSVLKLCESFRQEIELQSYASVEVEFTVSQGVSFGAETLDKMIAFADDALYKAKEQGRNQVVVNG